MTIIARKPAAKKTAKKTVAKKAAKKTAVKKPATKKVVAKKTTPKKAIAKKTVAKTVAKKVVAAKKPAPKKIAAKKVVAKKAAPVKKPVAPKVSKPTAPKAGKPVAPKAKKPAKILSPVEQLVAQITKILDDGKAEDIVTIDMAGKSAIADYMVIATGRSQRQLGALAENLRTQLKLTGKRIPHPEGMTQGDWVLLDAGDVVVHLFRPEVRGAYNLEKMWSQPFADSPSGMEGLIREREVLKERDNPQAPRDGQRPAGSKPDYRKRKKHRF